MVSQNYSGVQRAMNLPYIEWLKNAWILKYQSNKGIHFINQARPRELGLTRASRPILQENSVEGGAWGIPTLTFCPCLPAP